MKYIHSLLIVCAVIFLTACSDDDNMNTGHALVSMKYASPTTITVKENKMFKVPLVVEGEQNGPIKVTVEVTSNSEEYVEDKNFIVTSKTINIPAGKKEVGVEIRLVDDRVINDIERILTAKITSAKGAVIDPEASSVNIAILDNDNIPYDRMIGQWGVRIINGFTGEPMAWEAELIGYDDTDENYGKEYLLTPICDVSGNVIALETGNVGIPVKIKSSNKGGKETVELKINCGTIIAEGVNFDSTGDDPNLQDCRLRIVSYGVTGKITSGQITGKINDTFDYVEFDMPVVCDVLTKTNEEYTHLFYYGNMVMNMK